MTNGDPVEAWERLVRFFRTTTDAMDRHLRDRTGHSLDDYDVLHQIAVHDGAIRMGELAEGLMVAKSSCHRLVARLVEEALIERTPGLTDRREVFVELTTAGRRLHRTMAVIHTRDIQALDLSILQRNE
jgi:DNA-binding MarR family transcriptional regulator